MSEGHITIKEFIRSCDNCKHKPPIDKHCLIIQLYGKCIWYYFDYNSNK